MPANQSMNVILSAPFSFARFLALGAFRGSIFHLSPPVFAAIGAGEAVIADMLALFAAFRAFAVKLDVCLLEVPHHAFSLPLLVPCPH